MTKRTSCIFAASSVLLSGYQVYGNIELLSAADSRQWVRVQEMHWLATLSPEQLAEIRSALGSPKSVVVEAALANVFLHRLDNLAPMIGEGVGPPKSYVRDFARICASILSPREDPFEQLRQVLATELPGDDLIPLREKLRSFRPVRDMVTSVIVFEEIRGVRGGQKEEPNVKQLQLSLFEKHLLRLSGVAAPAAVRRVLDELSAVRVVTKREMTLIEVLHTYPAEQYVPMVLDKLESHGGRETYDSELLLRALHWRSHALRPHDKARLSSIIEAFLRSGPAPSTEATLAALEAELR